MAIAFCSELVCLRLALWAIRGSSCFRKVFAALTDVCFFKEVRKTHSDLGEILKLVKERARCDREYPACDKRDMMHGAVLRARARGDRARASPWSAVSRERGRHEEDRSQRYEVRWGHRSNETKISDRAENAASQTEKGK